MPTSSTRPLRAPRLRHGAAILALLSAFSVFAASGGCSLGNIVRDDCATNDECVLAIGPKSACVEGYCTEPPHCATGHDCRIQAGGGACVEGVCVSAFPLHPQCQTLLEPEDLKSVRLGAPGAPLVIGSIFSLEEAKDEALTRSIRLAAREINANGGLNNGQQLAVVFCDNGGKGNSAQGAERNELNAQALDYLAGTLGAPLIIGPLTSADSLNLVGRIKAKRYPTVLISPSATSVALTTLDDRLDPGDTGLFWRTCPSDLEQGEALAVKINEEMDVQKVGIIYVSDAYGQGLATNFRDAYTKNGKSAEVFPVQEADVNNPASLKPMSDLVNQQNPDALLVIAVQAGQTIQILKSLADTPVAKKKFFFTDGTKDKKTLFDPGLPEGVKAIIAKARGSAPASPSGSNYEFFRTSLQSAFGIDASGFSFTAHAYDAAYVGAYGIVWASRTSSEYDGRDVAKGLTKLSSGKDINIKLTDWPTGKSELVNVGQINVRGTSGDLDFVASTGEAPGIIEIWRVVGSTFVTD